MTTALEPPATLPELDGRREAWAGYLGRQFQEEIAYIRQRYDAGDAVAVHFADPTVEVVPPDAQLYAIAWGGFPRPLLVQERDGDIAAYPTADRLLDNRTMFRTAAGEPYEVHYRRGDEYLEWRAERDEHGRLRRITFTCESPDYWSAVAQGHPSPFFMLGGAEVPPPARGAGRLDLVLARYRELVSPEVEPGDLVFGEDLFDEAGTVQFRAGDYNPWNRWNVTDGIVHLSHPANTLAEEIELVGDATVLRRDVHGRPLQAAKCLLCCGGFGDVNRSSDPAIGAAVNELARAGYRVTIANPIGLYMSHVEDAGWTRPDGSPVPPAYWRVTRGVAGTPGLAGTTRAVRAVYEVPDGEACMDQGGSRPLRISDLRIGGEPIRYAGQVAEAVRMVLVVAAWPLTDQAPAPALCEPWFRCCRRRGGGQFLTVRYSRGGGRAPACGGADVEAYGVVDRSADERYRQMQRSRPAKGRRRRLRAPEGQPRNDDI